MNNPGKASNSADNEIINSIRDSTTSRKGEEDLFNTYDYFIKEGMRRHHLVQEEAFDAYADTIISAINKIRDGSFEGRSALKTWLHQIFHNKCVDLLRKKTTNKRAVHQTASINEMLYQMSDETKSVVQQLSDKADKALLREKLAELGDSCRRLLMLSSEGYTDKDIASEMQYKTAEVVKTSRLRCLDRLRKLYNRL